MAVQVKGIITVRCVKEDLPFVGFNAVAFESILVGGIACIKVNHQFAVLSFTLKDDTMDIPFNIGHRFGSYELDIVFVVGAHVNGGRSFWSVFVSVDIVGLNDDIDGTGVAVIVMKHQRNVPLLALRTAGLGSKVGLTEHHARCIFR